MTKAALACGSGHGSGKASGSEAMRLAAISAVAMVVILCSTVLAQEEACKKSLVDYHGVMKQALRNLTSIRLPGKGEYCDPALRKMPERLGKSAAEVKSAWHALEATCPNPFPFINLNDELSKFQDAIQFCDDNQR